ncbi:MAG: hypothetical protein AAF800_01645 [Planctomycetota bacterium]
MCFFACCAKPQAAYAEAVAYGPMVEVGRLQDARIDESSGVAASRVAEGQFWTHNDSGGEARLFRFDRGGETTAVVRLDAPRPRDYEDLASFVWNGRPWLLVADVGDNQAVHDFVTLWMLPEPDGTRRSEAVRVDVRYADGPRDCEAVAVDPVRGQVLLISKVDPRKVLRGGGEPVAAAYGFDLRDALRRLRDGGGDAGPLVVPRLAVLPLAIATGADVSPDGRRCVVLTYGDAWVFTRGEEQTWAEAFAVPPTRVPLGPRGQSEAVAFAADGRTLVVTTEGVNRPWWEVRPAEPTD